MSTRTLSGPSHCSSMRKAVAITATTAPVASPPTETVSSDSEASPGEKLAVTQATTATLNATSATESLSRLSPLSRIFRRGGSGILRTTELTATVSVDDNAAASAKHMASGTLGTSACRPKPITRMVSATRPIASPSTGLMACRSSRFGIWRASTYNRGGTSITNSRADCSRRSSSSATCDSATPAAICNAAMGTGIWRPMA